MLDDDEELRYLMLCYYINIKKGSLMRRLMLACVSIATLLAQHPAAYAADRIKIVAAENFYGELAREIGGQNVEVTSILSNPDDDPHLFETSPSTARTLATADVAIFNGAGYDGWMDKLLSVSTKKKRELIEAAKLVGAHDGDNPHLWYKPETLPAVAARLATFLEKADPAHAATFKANLAAFDKSFADIAKRVARMKKMFGGTGVTATEPVFGYMIQALGLKDHNQAFQIAMMNDTEPSPQSVAGFERSLKDGTVKVLFYNSQVTDATTKRLLGIAKSHKVAVVGVTETMPAGKTIASWFTGQLAEVDHALEKKVN